MAADGAGRKGAGGLRRFGAAERAVVVKAILNGATIAGAARAAGFSVQTLYTWRGRDAVFREAWDAAVEESGRPMLVAPSAGRRWQARRARRNRFTPERKSVFLEHFAVTCDARAAAAEAGIGVSTVFQHRRDDPGFAAGWQDALAQGYARLEAEALRHRLEAMTAIQVKGDKEVAGTGVEFERAMCLLKEYRLSLAGTPKAGRPPTRWRFEEAFAELEKKLKAFGVRVEEGEYEGGDG